MKRFHVHVHVTDLDQSVAFYSAMFAAQPSRLEADYAKWMIEEPRLNFAISTRGGAIGIDHLGLQADDPAELAELKMRAQAADMSLLDQGNTSCCYANSEKHWVTDPQGIAWEHFRTLSSIPMFSESGAAQIVQSGIDRESDPEIQQSACCSSKAGSSRPAGMPIKAASGCC